jgi:hypothetical protein
MNALEFSGVLQREAGPRRTISAIGSLKPHRRAMLRPTDRELAAEGEGFLPAA